MIKNKIRQMYLKVADSVLRVLQKEQNLRPTFIGILSLN